MGGHFLEKIFSPKSIAVFGASPHSESVGGVLWENLLTAPFPGRLVPINPKYQKIHEKTCFSSIKEVSENVDLAVIATPAETIPQIISEISSKRLPGALILSAGFRELGEKGAALEKEVVDRAMQGGVRLVGPNSLGILRPQAALNATFFKGKSKPGKLALISQSGALCSAILDWANAHDIGFSNVISLGASADIDFGDVLDFLTWDRETEAILLYIEGIRKARVFMSALKAAARIKPVFALKVGVYSAGRKAALSHTGAMVGTDEAFTAVLERAGVVRVRSMTQLFDAAETLASKMRSCGNRLAILTNGGGPGVLAADTAMDLGIPLAELSAKTHHALNKILPEAWSQGNPIDILGDATPTRYQEALQICLKDPQMDGIVVILTPQAMTQPLEVAQSILKIAKKSLKPILACWMGGVQVQAGQALFLRNNIPCFDSPVAAVESFSFLISFEVNQKMLLQMPSPLSDAAPADLKGAKMILESAPKKTPALLDQIQSKALLSAFHIPVSQAFLARSASEALNFGEELGFPVALKIQSPDITHKTEVEGVALNIQEGYALRSAYQRMIERVKRIKPETRIDGIVVEKMAVMPRGREIMVGVAQDPIFGPVINFGLGGTQVEILKEQAVALPPLNESIIYHLMKKTRAWDYLQNFRGFPPVKLKSILQILLRVSELVCELPSIQEMDLNPILVDENTAIVLDARVVLDPMRAPTRPYAHMAIHPYPSEYARKWQLPDGQEITIRPIRPEDAKIEKSFVDHLSARTKYFRFMGAMQELTQVMLVRFTQIDYDREMAFIATIKEGLEEKEIAVGRYVTYPDGETCEFAIVVADEWQGKGIGHQIMLDLIRVAQARGLKLMTGDIFSENRDMIAMVKNLGFTIKVSVEDPEVAEAQKVLNSTSV